MSKTQKPPASENLALPPEQEKFIQERRYMQNVSPLTVHWYRDAFRAFHQCSTASDFQTRIIEMRERGLSPVSVNTWLRVVNTYLHWLSDPVNKCSPACRHLKLPRLREDKKILATFSPEQVHRLLHVKPQRERERRAQAFAVLLLDTGLRLMEGLTLRRSQVDLENLLITVRGKGGRERRVPVTLEGRKMLHQWMRQLPQGEYVFPSHAGTPVEKRIMQHSLKELCERAGIKGVRCSPHTLRHTLAVTYLRKGGNLEYLRRILGHSSILVTQRYLQSLTPEDLQQVHNNLSPLAGR